MDPTSQLHRGFGLVVPRTITCWASSSLAESLQRLGVSHRSRSPLRLTATAFWMSVRRIRALARAKLGELLRWSHWNPETDLLQDVGRGRSFTLDAGSTVSGSEGACVYHRIICYGIYVMLAVDRGETLWFGCCQIYSKSLGMNSHDLSWTSA